MDLKSLSDKINTCIGDLASYDLEVRQLDLPGIPASCWETLSTVASAFEDALYEESIKYEELDFENETYLRPNDWDDEENEDGEDEDNDSYSDSDKLD